MLGTRNVLNCATHTCGIITQYKAITQLTLFTIYVNEYITIFRFNNVLNFRVIKKNFSVKFIFNILTLTLYFHALFIPSLGLH